MGNLGHTHMYFCKFAISLGTGPEPLKIARSPDFIRICVEYFTQIRTSEYVRYVRQNVRYNARYTKLTASSKLISLAKLIFKAYYFWRTQLHQAHLHQIDLSQTNLSFVWPRPCHCVLGIVGWRGALEWQVQHLTLLGLFAAPLCMQHALCD